MNFYWNHRIVNVPSENGGEDWYCLKEVNYDMDTHRPIGYGDPCLGSETHESCLELLKMFEDAVVLPPLQEKDFE
jgi:hypothetical protein